MGRPRVSLASLMGLVAVIALGMAGHFSASIFWTAEAATVTLMLLLGAVLETLPPRGAEWAFCPLRRRLLAEHHHSKTARIRVAGGGAEGDAPDAPASAPGLPHGQPQPPKPLSPSWDTMNHGGVQ